MVGDMSKRAGNITGGKDNSQSFVNARGGSGGDGKVGILLDQ